MTSSPENPFLTRIRDNRLLDHDQLRHSGSALQVLRTARLVWDLAAITSTLTVFFQVADLLFQPEFVSGEPAERRQHRYRHSLLAVDTINDLCAHWQPLLQRNWSFSDSEEHCAALTARLLGAFTGFAGAPMSRCPPEGAVTEGVTALSRCSLCHGFAGAPMCAPALQTPIHLSRLFPNRRSWAGLPF